MPSEVLHNLYAYPKYVYILSRDIPNMRKYVTIYRAIKSKKIGRA
jgi:hypothetical protein